MIGIGTVVFTVSLGGNIGTFVFHELDRFIGTTIFTIVEPGHVQHESGNHWMENPFQGNLWLDEMDAIGKIALRLGVRLVCYFHSE